MPAKTIANTTAINRTNTHPSSKSKSNKLPALLPTPSPTDDDAGSAVPQLPLAPPPPNDPPPVVNPLLPPAPLPPNAKSNGVDPRLQKASPKSPTSSALRLRSRRAQMPR